MVVVQPVAGHHRLHLAVDMIGEFLVQPVEKLHFLGFQHGVQPIAHPGFGQQAGGTRRHIGAHVAVTRIVAAVIAFDVGGEKQRPIIPHMAVGHPGNQFAAEIPYRIAAA